jgi:AraC family transcriptional regulator
MSAAHASLYRKRIQKVLRYIGAHLDEELTVETLSEVAGFSKYHFHRQFSAYTGVTVAKLIALLRLKRASLQLAFDTDQQIIDVAYAAGFKNPESFSRAFRQTQQQSPSQFRRAPEWERWAEIFKTPQPMEQDAMQPTITHFPETKVAVLEHRGPPATILNSVGRFIEWRKSCSDSPVLTSQTYGIAYDDPEKVAPEHFRFDICGSVTAGVSTNTYGMIEKTIPAGRCAVARHEGSTDLVGNTVRALFVDWLPGSGEALRDFPIYFHYIKRMPTVSEHEQVTDVYLPLQARG